MSENGSSGRLTITYETDASEAFGYVVTVSGDVLTTTDVLELVELALRGSGFHCPLGGLTIRPSDD